MLSATPGLLYDFHFFHPGFFKAQSMSAGWSKYFSLLPLDRIKIIGIRRRKRKRRAGSALLPGVPVSFAGTAPVSWGMFMRVCMCVFVSLCFSVCACMYIYMYVHGLDFGLLVPGWPSNPFCNLQQKHT